MDTALVTKCSRCEGDITFLPGINIIKCPWCDRPNSRPKSQLDEEIRLMEYANERRNLGEFEEAEQGYRKVLQSYDDEHEARWGLLLCKYGVIYVEGGSRERLITCRKSVNTRFCSEPDYLAVLAQAPAEVRSAYKKDGQYIDQVQEQIRLLRRKTPSYDVFLCYKESSENGGKTRDSAIAHEIFNQLESQNYRTFFAPVSLRDMAGANYEAAIFLAIESSRMMLVIGTKKEYFTSLYVRSEWRRFMERLRFDDKKLLIPMFEQGEDLPAELHPFQGYSLRSPYLPDVVSRLNKALQEGDSPWEAGFIFLEDGDFQDARTYFQDMLSQYSREPMVWLGLGMAEEELRREEDWKTVSHTLEENKNFSRALRYAKGALRNRLESYAAEVEARIAEDKVRQEEEARIAAEKARKEEEARIAAEKARKEEEARIAAEKARKEEEKRIAAEKVRREEEARIAAEKARREEEARRAEEERKAKEEAERKAREAREEEARRNAALTKTNAQNGRKKRKHAFPIFLIIVFALGAGGWWFSQQPSASTLLTAITSTAKPTTKPTSTPKPTTVPSATKDFTYKLSDGSVSVTGYNGNSTILVIPDQIDGYPVTSIGAFAFSGCSGLTSVTIPSSVTSIGHSAFSGCSSLTSVTIPSSVTSIGGSAFRGCSSLTSVTIPNSVTSIGSGAFDGCSGLTSVTIPNSVTSIGDYIFSECSNLTSVTIPNSVTSIEGWTFDGCSSLTSVTIPNSVTSIENGAFSRCSSLTSVTIPNSVTSIGYSVFQGCSSLTSVTIPNSVTSIGNGAFLACSSLTSVTIPNSVTSIEGGTFTGCSSLTIYGKKGSYAETYAKTNSIPFVSN